MHLVYLTVSECKPWSSATFDMNIKEEKKECRSFYNELKAKGFHPRAVYTKGDVSDMSSWKKLLESLRKEENV